MGRLTTHVLDTANGKPGADILVELFRLDGEQRIALGAQRTNRDGRCDAPLLEGDALQAPACTNSISRSATTSPRARRNPVAEPRFIDVVTMRFGIADASAHYHVPLLASPYSYSTYRGS
jgi:5-hydroxyisourate hydrolase